MRFAQCATCKKDALLRNSNIRGGGGGCKKLFYIKIYITKQKQDIFGIAKICLLIPFSRKYVKASKIC